jgi:hypothetical protein
MTRKSMVRTESHHRRIKNAHTACSYGVVLLRPFPAESLLEALSADDFPSQCMQTTRDLLKKSFCKDRRPYILCFARFSENPNRFIPAEYRSNDIFVRRIDGKKGKHASVRYEIVLPPASDVRRRTKQQEPDLASNAPSGAIAEGIDKRLEKEEVQSTPLVALSPITSSPQQSTRAKQLSVKNYGNFFVQTCLAAQAEGDSKLLQMRYVSTKLSASEEAMLRNCQLPSIAISSVSNHSVVFAAPLATTDSDAANSEPKIVAAYIQNIQGTDMTPITIPIPKWVANSSAWRSLQTWSSDDPVVVSSPTDLINKFRNASQSLYVAFIRFSRRRNASPTTSAPPPSPPPQPSADADISSTTSSTSNTVKETPKSTREFVRVYAGLASSMESRWGSVPATSTVRSHVRDIALCVHAACENDIAVVRTIAPIDRAIALQYLKRDFDDVQQWHDVKLLTTLEPAPLRPSELAKQLEDAKSFLEGLSKSKWSSAIDIEVKKRAQELVKSILKSIQEIKPQISNISDTTKRGDTSKDELWKQFASQLNALIEEDSAKNAKNGNCRSDSVTHVLSAHQVASSDCFVFIVKDNIEEKELRNKEIELIALLNSSNPVFGYNRTK